MSKKKKASSSFKNSTREPMSVRVAPRLKQLLADAAAAQGLTLARFVERVLWASDEVRKALLQDTSPPGLSRAVPLPLYSADEMTLAHLTLLARATHYLEEMARVMSQGRQAHQPLDAMKVAEALHAVKAQFERLRPLHLPRKTAFRIKDTDGNAKVSL